MQSQSKSQQSLRKMTAKWVLKFAWKYNRAGIIKRHLKKEKKVGKLVLPDFKNEGSLLLV